jgi:hypothetical protein
MKMMEFFRSAWASVMDESRNPLRNSAPIAAHMIMQILAWMWSAIFAAMFSSYVLFGVTAFLHALLIGGIFFTYVVFRSAERGGIPDRSGRSPVEGRSGGLLRRHCSSIGRCRLEPVPMRQ